MPCQALLVTIRTYSRHFESLYPVWWNWGFAPSENKFAKTINLQWSYSIHQRFLFSPYVYLVPVHLFVCLLSVSSCLWEWNFSFEDSFAWMFAFVGIFVNFIQEARFCFCFWLYAPPAKRLCTFASPCTKSWESVSSRDLHICTFGRDVYLHLTLICTLQINKHHYIVTNMEIQHYTLFCDCLCNKSPAESSSLPSRFWRKSSHLGNRDFRHLFSVSWRLLGRGK